MRNLAVIICNVVATPDTCVHMPGIDALTCGRMSLNARGSKSIQSRGSTYAVLEDTCVAYSSTLPPSDFAWPRRIMPRCLHRRPRFALWTICQHQPISQSLCIHRGHLHQASHPSTSKASKLASTGSGSLTVELHLAYQDGHTRQLHILAARALGMSKRGAPSIISQDYFRKRHSISFHCHGIGQPSVSDPHGRFILVMHSNLPHP
jgi:hypothetical protein